MLVITDGSFSVAGVVCSWIAIFLIAQEYHWSGVYQFVALIAALIIFLSSLSTFPATDVDDHETSGPEKWPFPVWLCIVGLFLYTLGQWAWANSSASSGLACLRHRFLLPGGCSKSAFDAWC
jgi:TsgA-like MFS transporter